MDVKPMIGVLSDLIEDAKREEKAYIREAIKTLGINVPYYRYAIEDDGTLVIWLYGGRVVQYLRDGPVLPEPPEPCDRVSGLTLEISPKDVQASGGFGGTTTKVVTTNADHDDFTVLSGIGVVTALKLYDAGIMTFADLRDALFDRKLIEFSDRVKEAIFQYFEEENQ